MPYKILPLFAEQSGLLLAGVVSNRAEISRLLMLIAEMPTSFLSLPIELRSAIYDYALQELTVTIILDVKQVYTGSGCSVMVTENRMESRAVPGVELPDDAQLKAQLFKQKHVIALLFTCRQVHEDLDRSLYSRMNLRVRASVCQSESDTFPALHNLAKNAPMRTLVHRIGTIIAPMIMAGSWRATLCRNPDTEFGGLRRMILYDEGIRLRKV